MKNSFTPLLCGALLMAAPFSLLAADAKLASGDETFIMKAAQGGMTEVKLGEVAGSKAKREDVKTFGKRMVQDHSAANAELKTLAAKKGVTIPDALDSSHASMVDKMSKMEGDDFDKHYVADMVKDHEKDVKDFEQEAKSGQDADVKAFAAKTLPTLKSHLEQIKGMAGKK